MLTRFFDDISPNRRTVKRTHAQGNYSVAAEGSGSAVVKSASIVPLRGLVQTTVGFGNPLNGTAHRKNPGLQARERSEDPKA